MEVIKEAVLEFVANLIKNPGVVLIGTLTLFEVVPIKIYPWRWIAKQIRQLFYGDILKEIEGLKTQIQKNEAAAEKDRAEIRRVRILNFGDELLHDHKHSKESFDQTLNDITEYEEYCRDHPEFKNDMTVSTTEVIKEQYKKCYKEHSFL